MTVIYHKQKVFDKCTALRLLALIRPNLVIPDVLERTYSSFDSLTEPHKLITLISCMSFLAKQMVQGPRYMNGGMKPVISFLCYTQKNIHKYIDIS